MIALGSNDPGYSASKIFPCILARKPLLAVFHRDSPVHGLMQAVGLAGYGFAPEGTNESLVELIATQWFAGVQRLQPAELVSDAVRPFTAASMTESMVKCFNQAVHHA